MTKRIYICILVEEINLNYGKMFIKIHCNSCAIFSNSLASAVFSARDGCFGASVRSKAMLQGIHRDLPVFSHLCVKIDLVVQVHLRFHVECIPEL